MSNKRFGFGLIALKKFPELIPLVGSVGFALALGIGFIGYALLTKTDITINKNRPPRFEEINPEQSQKLLNFNVKYQKIPELESLKKEIGSFKAN